MGVWVYGCMDVWMYLEVHGICLAAINRLCSIRQYNKQIGPRTHLGKAVEAGEAIEAISCTAKVPRILDAAGSDTTVGAGRSCVFLVGWTPRDAYPDQGAYTVLGRLGYASMHVSAPGQNGAIVTD